MVSEKQIKLIRLADCETAKFLNLFLASEHKVGRWLGSAFTPSSEKELTELTKLFLQRNEYAVVVSNRDDNYVGFGFLNSINYTHKFCNIGYWIGSGLTGQGYAKNSGKLLLDFAYSKLKLVRVELVIEPSNIASEKVAIGLGCIKEGLLRKRIFGREANLFAHTI